MSDTGGPAPDGLGADGLAPDGLGADGLAPDGLGADGLAPDGLAPGGLGPVGPPAAGDETATLLGSLERQRSTFAWKVGGLGPDGLAARVGASSITLGGLLKHLAFVEELKFSTMVHGRPPGPPWDTVDWDADGDWPWHSAARDTPEALYTLWHDAVVLARAALAEALSDGGLDRRVVYGFDDGEDPPSLRRLLVDVIEEYARHTGHADLVRESVDALVGEDPPGQVWPYPPLVG